jgi:hypothetical protein
MIDESLRNLKSKMHYPLKTNRLMELKRKIDILVSIYGRYGFKNNYLKKLHQLNTQPNKIAKATDQAKTPSWILTKVKKKTHTCDKDIKDPFPFNRNFNIYYFKCGFRC